MKLLSANKFLRSSAFIFILAAVLPGAFAEATAQNSLTLTNTQINFDHDIRPIFETSCLRCHGPQKPKSHFRLDYREGALAGGDNNTNDIIPGNSSQSLLINYVAGQVPDMEMPP